MTIKEYIEQYCESDDTDDTLCEVTLGDLRRWADSYEPKPGSIEAEIRSQEQIVLERILIEGNTADMRLRLDQELALRIARGFGALLADAPNYNEISMTNPTLHDVGDWITITIQRVSGETPGSVNHKLRLELQQLKELADDLMEDAMALRGEWAGWKDGSSSRYQREYDELSARIEKAMGILRPGETAP